MPIACLQSEMDTGEIAATFEKPNQQVWGAYFCKCDVVAVIKMGAYIHGVLILCGCFFTVARVARSMFILLADRWHVVWNVIFNDVKR